MNDISDVRKIAELPYDWYKLNNSVIMISGGTGFIGSFMIDVFRYRNKHMNDNIKVISLSRHGGEDDDTVRNLSCDISKGIDCDEKADYVIHLASNTHPKQYAEDPVGTITTNILGCNNLLKYAVEKCCKRFLLASSVEIYGQGEEKPMNEAYSGYIDCNNARAGYNEAKRTCEALCRSYEKQHGVESVTVRLARVFGADKKNDTKAMSQFMDKAVAGEDIILKSKGNQRFSYIYVADAVGGIIKILTEGVSGEAYNLSDEDEGMTLGGYAEYMAKLAGRSVIYETEDNEAVSKATYALLDCKKIKDLGWTPQYTVSEGLKKTFEIKKQLKY